jgi:hypothetical protein
MLSSIGVIYFRYPPELPGVDLQLMVTFDYFYIALFRLHHKLQVNTGELRRIPKINDTASMGPPIDALIDSKHGDLESS